MNCYRFTSMLLVCEGRSKVNTPHSPTPCNAILISALQRNGDQHALSVPKNKRGKTIRRVLKTRYLEIVA